MQPDRVASSLEPQRLARLLDHSKRWPVFGVKHAPRALPDGVVPVRLCVASFLSCGFRPGRFRDCPRTSTRAGVSSVARRG